MITVRMRPSIQGVTSIGSLTLPLQTKSGNSATVILAGANIKDCQVTAERSSYAWWPSKNKRTYERPMPSLDDLARAFEEAARNRWAGTTEQLSHVDMINLADTLTGWAMSRGVSREWSARLIGWAETMQRLADKVGPTWNPPEPQELSLIGVLARRLRER